MQKLFIALIIGLMLAGCPLTKNMNDSDTGTGSGGVGTDSSGTTDVGGTIVVQENNSGMSDPSRCNNLPAEQMADCLEQSMGG
jgi:hypothetical protein